PSTDCFTDPTTTPVSTLSLHDALPILPVIPAGVPSTVLSRRPDVSAAQSSLLAAQTRVGVAKAAWFPSLTLTATGGYASPELGEDRKSTRLNSSHQIISYGVFCL